MGASMLSRRASSRAIGEPRQLAGKDSNACSAGCSGGGSRRNGPAAYPSASSLARPELDLDLRDILEVHRDLDQPFGGLTCCERASRTANGSRGPSPWDR